MPSVYKLDLNERKSVTVNVFRGEAYFHIRDGKKEKCVSLTFNEVARLYKNTSKLLKNAKRLLKESKNGEKQDTSKKQRKTKKTEKKKAKQDSSSSGSDTDEEDMPMEGGDDSD